MIKLAFNENSLVKGKDERFRQRKLITHIYIVYLDVGESFDKVCHYSLAHKTEKLCIE